MHTQESRRGVAKSVLRAVLGRMQFTLHATRRAPHGASRLVQAMSAWSVKTRRLRPGIVGMQGSMVIRLRPCINRVHPPLESPPGLYYTWYIGWVGVGWQRQCKTWRSLHELVHQGTVFLCGRSQMVVELDNLCGAEKSYSAQGE